MKKLCHKIYGENKGSQFYQNLSDLLNNYKNQIPETKSENLFSYKDIILITYADQIQSPKENHLKSLHHFLNSNLKKQINTVHLLPFFPYSSDDGFSVIDYKQVKSESGNWDDIENLKKDYKLVFDGVINHISQESSWFKAYLKGDPDYNDFFISMDKATDLSQVVRPRPHPVLSEFQTSQGKKHIWTTFSRDQIDLNFANPKVLLKIIDVILFYASKGAKILRLDAIAYLWKEKGTSCIHHHKTHLIIKLIRKAIETLNADLLLLSETNVPHEENISYFGNQDEAHMVYQFTLPPLTAHAILRQNSEHLYEWAKNLYIPPGEAAYFNFTASHDGIGVRPLTGILDKTELNFMIETTMKRGGAVSYKKNSDGSESPYELNINYRSLLTDPSDPDIGIKAFLLSQAICLTMPGVPGIYFHSLIGSLNWEQGPKQTGHKRSINREKIRKEDLYKQIELSENQGKIFLAYKKLITIRISQKAFDPKADFKCFWISSSLFCFSRGQESESVLCIYNLEAHEKTVQLPAEWQTGKVIDLLNNTPVEHQFPIFITIGAYEFLWLKKIK